MTTIEKLSQLRLRLKEKIEKLEAALVIARSELEANATALEEAKRVGQSEEALLSGLPNGSTITFRHGKGENNKVVTAQVVGFKPGVGRSPALYKATTGQGFDTTVYTVPVYSITAFSQPIEG